MSQITCLKHEFVAQSHSGDGTPNGYVLLEFDNSRAVALDHNGITDFGDYQKAEAATPEQPYVCGFISWAEIFERECRATPYL
jgi:hypothetical protein